MTKNNQITTKVHYHSDNKKQMSWSCEKEHNQTTTEAKIARILEHEHSRSFCKREIMQLIAKEKKAILEEVKANLPEVDKAEAVKHRPDNSVGFMLGWNAYEEKLQKLLKILAHSQEEREGK